MGNNKKDFHHEELIGKRFGRLIVTEIVGNKDSHSVYILCRCDCGTIKELRKFCVTSGNTRSCGCFSKESKRARQWKGCGEISGQVMLVFQKNARNRNIAFDVTKEYIWNLYLKQDKKCALSGVDLYFSPTNGKRTASLDRIDSTKGYIEGNVQWVHKTINVMKSYMPESEFFDWCEKIVNFRKVIDN